MFSGVTFEDWLLVERLAGCNVPDLLRVTNTTRSGKAYTIILDRLYLYLYLHLTEPREARLDVFVSSRHEQYHGGQLDHHIIMLVGCAHAAVRGAAMRLLMTSYQLQDVCCYRTDVPLDGCGCL